MNHVTLRHPISVKLIDKRVLITAFDSDPELSNLDGDNLVQRHEARVLYGQRHHLRMRVTLIVPASNIAGIVIDSKDK